MSVLKSDSTNFLFVLQPMLHRSINKDLTPTEKRFLTEVSNLISGTWTKKKDDIMILYKYFYDNHLSLLLSNIIQQKDFMYLDMNKEISTLKNDFEFYTDYCHLTKKGNKYFSEVLGKKILANININTN